MELVAGLLDRGRPVNVRMNREQEGRMVEMVGSRRASTTTTLSSSTPARGVNLHERSNGDTLFITNQLVNVKATRNEPR